MRTVPWEMHTHSYPLKMRSSIMRTVPWEMHTHSYPLRMRYIKHAYSTMGNAHTFLSLEDEVHQTCVQYHKKYTHIHSYPLRMRSSIMRTVQ